MDQQRSAIYAHRDWVLKGEELDSNISEIIRDMKKARWIAEIRREGDQKLPAFLPPDSRPA